MAEFRVLINPYLNAAPLWWTLKKNPPPGWVLQDALPAAAVQALGVGECDLALISAAALPSLPGVKALRDWGVAAEGPVETVVVVLKKPLAQVSTLGVDSASRSAQMLLRLLCLRRFHITPQFVPVEDPAQALLELDAVLAIGDKSFTLGKGLPRIDLAQEWHDWTGLPFLFAVWAARAEAATPDVSFILNGAAESGASETAAIAAHFGKNLRLSVPRLEHYLRGNVRHRLGERDWEGFARFINEACGARLLEAPAAPDFF